MLKESLRVFEEAEKDLMDGFKREVVADNIERMDSNTFSTIQSIFKFMEASRELIRQQTLTLEEMDRKLNTLLKERKS